MMMLDEDCKRAFWHSRRGMLELDLVLLPFVENVYPTLSDEDKQRYHAMLTSEDQDMFRWFVSADEPEKEHEHIVQKIIAYARTPKDER